MKQTEDLMTVGNTIYPMHRLGHLIAQVRRTGPIIICQSKIIIY